MKKLILSIMLIILSITINAQSYTREGNTFISFTGVLKTKTEPVKTAFTWKDSKGNEYPIYISKTGSCFVIKISNKTGKEYRKYLGPEVSAQICKELGVEYKYKRN